MYARVMSINDEYFKNYFHRNPTQSELDLFASFIGDRIDNIIDSRWEELNQGARDDINECLLKGKYEF